MAKIAVDVALLLPEEINKICIDINRKEGAEATSDLSKSNNHPHITLAMGVIDKEDIPKVNSKLKEIVSGFSELNLEISHEIKSEKNKSYGFGIKPTDEIKKLHAAIMKKLIFTYDVTLDMFYKDSDEVLNEISRYWVESYRTKDPENYQPHISLKCKNAEYSKLPIKFTTSKIVLCHLGNHCTCREILGEFEL